MKRLQTGLLALILAIAGVVLYLASRNRQPPLLPRDGIHEASSNDCLSCHGPDGPSPRSPNHPLGADCRRCHGQR